MFILEISEILYFFLINPQVSRPSFFASSSEASHLLAMQTELKNRVRTAKREKKFQQSKMVLIAEELDSLQDLPLVNLELEAARDLKEHSDKISGEIPVIENLMQHKSELEEIQANLIEREKGLAGLQAGPELFPIAPLESVSSRIEQLRDHGHNLKKRSLSLDEIKSPPELFPVQRLEAESARQMQLSRAAANQSVRSNVLKALISPPELEDVSSLSTTISNIVRNLNYRAGIAGRSKRLSPLTDPPDLFDSSQLIQTVNTISSLKQSKKEMQRRIADLEQSGSDLKKRIERRLTEIGSCPLCGGELEAEKLIGERSYES